MRRISSKLTNRRTLIIIAVAVFVPIVFLVSSSLFSSKPDNLGVNQGRLAACPESPNCVSTQALDEKHFIEPIAFAGSPDSAIQAIKEALATMPRINIVSETDDYLHAEATSLVFRFVDDLEFLVDEQNKLIQFRSASRIGHSDFGANRSRMERFREIFEREN